MHIHITRSFLNSSLDILVLVSHLPPSTSLPNPGHCTSKEMCALLLCVGIAEEKGIGKAGIKCMEGIGNKNLRQQAWQITLPIEAHFGVLFYMYAISVIKLEDQKLLIPQTFYWPL